MYKGSFEFQHYDRLEEGIEITKLLKQMPTKIEIGAKWYILPMKFFKQWEVYSYADIVSSQDIMDSIDRECERERRPDEITFTELFLPIDKL